MTDIEAKALALVNEVRAEDGDKDQLNYLTQAYERDYFMAMLRAIEQHEAFKQEVSDAAEQYNDAAAPMGWEGFDRFIIPKPKPDPLADVLRDFGGFMPDAEDFRAALEARGLEIRSKTT